MSALLAAAADVIRAQRLPRVDMRDIGASGSPARVSTGEQEQAGHPDRAVPRGRRTARRRRRAGGHFPRGSALGAAELLRRYLAFSLNRARAVPVHLQESRSLPRPASDARAGSSVTTSTCARTPCRGCAATEPSGGEGRRLGLQLLPSTRSLRPVTHGGPRRVPTAGSAPPWTDLGPAAGRHGQRVSDSAASTGSVAKWDTGLRAPLPSLRARRNRRDSRGHDVHQWFARFRELRP